MIVCNVYISLGLFEFKHSIKKCWISHFNDKIYQRTGITIAGHYMDVKRETLQLIDKIYDIKYNNNYNISTQNIPNHPRIGLIDHILLLPLKQNHLNDSIQTCIDISQYIGNQYCIPTYLYGLAHKNERNLVELRKNLGFFNNNNYNMNQNMIPDYGPNIINEKYGMTICGCMNEFFLGYNIPVYTQNKSIANKIRKSIKSMNLNIHAMTLKYDNIYEIGINIFNGNDIIIARIYDFAKIKSTEMGVALGIPYKTGPTKEELLEFFDDDCVIL